MSGPESVAPPAIDAAPCDPGATIGLPGARTSVLIAAPGQAELPRPVLGRRRSAGLAGRHPQGEACQGRVLCVFAAGHHRQHEIPGRQQVGGQGEDEATEGVGP